MTMPFYSSVDQLLRDRSELARKGIARGRSVVVLTYTGGVLFVAENRSSTLHKVSEVYDRIGFAAVGRYNEFETLRNAGIRMADVRGYSYDRRDVTGRMLANFYAQVLGSTFVEQQKPYEVELCLAAVGTDSGSDQLYRVTYDGSITAEPSFVVMGGTTDPISAKLKDTYRAGLELAEAIGPWRAWFSPNDGLRCVHGLLSALDLVEVNPTLDVRNQTALLGVELALSALGMKIL